MKLIRDNIELNPNYPFRIYKVILNEKNQPEDTFHWHSYFEITYVCRGTGTYLVRGEEYSVQAGDLILFNNVEPHGVQVVSSELTLLVMIFSSEFIVRNSEEFDAEYLKPFIERGSNFRNRIGREEPVSKGIVQMLKDTYQEWNEKEEGYRLMIKANTLRILTMLTRACQNREKPEEYLDEKKKKMKRLEDVLSYLDGHFTQKITLEQAAAIAYMSTNYFSAYFKTVMGCSFSEYITRLRIEEARKQLRTTHKSVVEIAVNCGFQNIANFYRLYKRYVGTLPKDERNSHIDD